jgi:hypothetical protein
LIDLAENCSRHLPSTVTCTTQATTYSAAEHRRGSMRLPDVARTVSA